MPKLRALISIAFLWVIHADGAGSRYRASKAWPTGIMAPSNTMMGQSILS
ncbi:MAG TPA: hypothetical protein VMR20_11925 [Verrucomicrobiae bacterium]|nr:hypothetical protein [Verrucomicrobiae bacterium]